MKLKEVIVPTANEIEAYQEGKLSERKRILEIIKKLDEPSNRFNLRLNNQERLAYFQGYKDTIQELKQVINQQEKTA